MTQNSNTFGRFLSALLVVACGCLFMTPALAQAAPPWNNPQERDYPPAAWRGRGDGAFHSDYSTRVPRGNLRGDIENNSRLRPPDSGWRRTH
ncbi:MAG: hypothetical protein ACRYG5_09245 [Janthinobacterium lividum]